MVEEFLGLPMRPAKPRERGWPHVIDKGMSLPEVQGMIDTAGDYVDIVKMRWGTSYVTQNLAEKIRVYQAAGIPVMCGGTLLEAAIARGRVEEFKRWTLGFGFTHVEVSDGTIQIERDSKLELISALAEEFVVLSEVGSKYAECIFSPYQWGGVDQGGDRGRRGQGHHRGPRGRDGGDLPGKRRGAVRPHSTRSCTRYRQTTCCSRRPQKDQQAWFIRHLGPEVNLGNIPPEEVIPLETLRLGLRADTLREVLLGDERPAPA